MVKIRKFKTLNEEEITALKDFLDTHDHALPYHTIEFGKVIDAVFGYENLSLAAFDLQGKAMGFLPQWKKGGQIESVPWRDKGGPVFLDDEVLQGFIRETKSLVNEKRLRGFLWRDFKTEYLDHFSYLVNVKIDLTSHTCENFWKEISFKVRGKVKNALSSGLIWKMEDPDTPTVLRSFYELFVFRRKNIGVPVYPFKLFETYFKKMLKSQIRLFCIYKENLLISSLILLCNRHMAVDAYSASSDLGMKLKANDLMICKVISYCLENNFKIFDFGADSPFQQSLTQYKMKWLGEKSQVDMAFFGNAKEKDHNEPKYDFMKKIIRNMPMWMYLLFSKLVIR